MTSLSRGGAALCRGMTMLAVVVTALALSSAAATAQDSTVCVDPEWSDGAIIVRHRAEPVNALAFRLLLTTADRERLTVTWRVARHGARDLCGDVAPALCHKRTSFTEKRDDVRHSIPVTRAYAGTSYLYEVRTELGRVVARGRFTTGQLPLALALFNNTVDVVAPGASLDMLYFTSNSLPDLFHFAIEATTGRIVWYIEHNDGPLYVVRWTRTGWAQVPVSDPHDPDYFAYVLLDSPALYRKSPMGDILDSTGVLVPVPPQQRSAYPPSAFPHGCEALSHWMVVDGNFAYAVGDQVVMLDGQCYYDGTVWRWNMATHEAEVWIQLKDLFPIDPSLHYGPINVGWTNCGADRLNLTQSDCRLRFHVNFLQASGWNDYFVINSNNAGYGGVTLIVDQTTRELKYVISPSDAISDFAFVDEADKYYGEHFVQLHGPDPHNPFTDKPTLLVYDDGAFSPYARNVSRAFSRVALYELDFDALTIRLLFQYSPPTVAGSDYAHCFSAITGSVVFTEDRHFVANFPCQDKPFPPYNPAHGTNVFVELGAGGDVLTMMHSEAPKYPYNAGWTKFMTPIGSVAGERVHI